MKFCAAFFALLLTLILGGCSGGGAGGGGGGGPFFLVRVESPGVDPLNILVGQNVAFVIAGYEVGSGNRVVLTATSWSVLDNQAVGSINGNGQFTAAMPGNARIGATWNGTPTVTPLPITVRSQNLAGIRGTVRSAGQPVAGVVVIFYNAADVEVGRATSLTNGQFTGYVPTTAVRMNLDVASLEGRWLKQWGYRGEVYQAGPTIPNCHAAFVLGTPLAIGQTSVMADPIDVYDLNLPPPFPTGCK